MTVASSSTNGISGDEPARPGGPLQGNITVFLFNCFIPGMDTDDDPRRRSQQTMPRWADDPIPLYAHPTHILEQSFQ